MNTSEPIVAPAPPDPIAQQMERLDATLAETNRLRQQLIDKGVSVVSAQLDNANEMNAAKLAAVAGLFSSVTGAIHQHEATAAGRVKLETSRKQVENEDAVAKTAIAMLRRMDVNRPGVPNATTGFDQALVDKELEARFLAEAIVIQDGEVEAVDVEGIQATTEAIGRKVESEAVATGVN
jgi:hypothetical protein